LECSDQSEELYDAKVKVLGVYIDHRVTENEGELFALARPAKLDLAAMEEALPDRKAEFMAELGMTEHEPPMIATCRTHASELSLSISTAP
jgi:hypothetical protein